MSKAPKKEVTYNTVPHYIARQFRRGELTLNEMRVLFWLRAIGTPYGVASTSMDALQSDALPELKKNTVNSILISLHQKQHIFYEKRQGKDGSFDIELNHWKRPDKTYKTLDRYFSEPRVWSDEEKENTHDTDYPQLESSESHQKLGVLNQKLEDEKEQLAKGFSVHSDDKQIRSYHTNTDTDTYLKADDYSTANKEERNTKLVPTTEFEPKTAEQQRCKEIALEIKDEYINSILGKLKKANYDIETIERGYRDFKETCRDYERNGKTIRNLPAFFNTHLEIFLANEGYDNP